MRCHHCGRDLLGLRSDHESLCFTRQLTTSTAGALASSAERVRRSVASLIAAPGAGVSIPVGGATEQGVAGKGATVLPFRPRRLSYRVVPLHQRRGFELLPNDAA